MTDKNIDFDMISQASQSLDFANEGGKAVVRAKQGVQWPQALAKAVLYLRAQPEGSEIVFEHDGVQMPMINNDATHNWPSEFIALQKQMPRSQNRI